MRIELLHYNEQTITHNLLLNNGAIIGQQVTLLHSGTGENLDLNIILFGRNTHEKILKDILKVLKRII